jgi:sugar phosphate isomerase/epimerase
MEGYFIRPSRKKFNMKKLPVQFTPYLSLKNDFLVWISLVLIVMLFQSCRSFEDRSVFAEENLVAWCVVPYDAENRGPEERAQMLKELGITMLAYDWREEHVPSFDQEWQALNEEGIRLQAFWMMTGQDPAQDRFVQEIFDFLERNQVQTQIWLLLGEPEGFGDLGQEEKVKTMAEPIRYIADRAEALDCKVGLYNHGGWFGEPENQIEIIQHLGLDNIGIVYNVHHARSHHQRFPDFFPKMKPFLYAINLAGLKAGDTEKFYGIGEGDVEENMIRIILESDYQGPIGIINHDENRDAKVGLEREMVGLKEIVRSIKEK